MMVSSDPYKDLLLENESLPIPNFDNPKHYAAEVTKASGSSFFLPMLLLPRPRREAMLALYAFCRETDDVADEIPDMAVSSILLKAWESEIDKLFKGEPRHPVTIALMDPIDRYGLEKQYFLGILEGFEMDRSGAMLRPTLEELERYCYCVACCVGLLSVEIFGYKSTNIPAFAVHLGHAFQLTNILRDVAEDANRGRIYLPFELLDKHGLKNINPEEIVREPKIIHVCKDLGEIAHQHFIDAAKLLPKSERRRMRPAILMRSVYQHYLYLIERDNYQVGNSRIRVGKAGKLFLILRALIHTL